MSPAPSSQKKKCVMHGMTIALTVAAASSSNTATAEAHAQRHAAGALQKSCDHQVSASLQGVLLLWHAFKMPLQAFHRPSKCHKAGKKKLSFPHSWFANLLQNCPGRANCCCQNSSRGGSALHANGKADQMQKLCC